MNCFEGSYNALAKLKKLHEDEETYIASNDTSLSAYVSELGYILDELEKNLDDFLESYENLMVENNRLDLDYRILSSERDVLRDEVEKTLSKNYITEVENI